MQLPGPAEIIRQQLANGLTILALRRPDLPFATMSLEVRAGSTMDVAERAGLASLTAAALARGTRRRSAAQLFIDIDNLGMELSAGAGTDGADVDIRSLLEDLPQALTLLAEVLQEPAFDATEVDKLRDQTLARLQEAEDDTDYVAERELRLRIFPPGHPYRLPGAGWQHTVAPLTAQDLAAFHHRLYRPEKAVLAVVGAIDPDRLLPAIEAALGNWRSADVGTSPAPADSAMAGEGPVSAGETVHITLNGKSQSEIALGGVAPARTAADYEALSVANLILGRLGLGGRIGANVREQRGLAYSAYSLVVAYQRTGFWMVRAGVAPGNVAPAVEAIRAELARFCREPVTDQELADAKGFVLGSLPMRLEKAGGMVDLLLAMERYQLGLDYLQQYPGVIGSLTADDLLAAVQRHLRPEAALAVVVGPGD